MTGVGSGSLADRQAALVAALTAGAPVPDGFDVDRIGVATRALLHKRAGEVARRWPLLVAELGPRWHPEFQAWAGGRPTRGSLRDGWDFALVLRGRQILGPLAEQELAAAEQRWIYDGTGPPVPRPNSRLRTLARRLRRTR